MSYNKTLFLGGGWRTRTRLKMRTRWAIVMSKVRDNSAPKLILGAWSLAIPRQACLCHRLYKANEDLVVV